jgi:uncharacterized protein (UPF0335 family)
MSETDNVTGERLRSFVERIEQVRAGPSASKQKGRLVAALPVSAVQLL